MEQANTMECTGHFQMPGPKYIASTNFEGGDRFSFTLCGHPYLRRDNLSKLFEAISQDEAGFIIPEGIDGDISEQDCKKFIDSIVKNISINYNMVMFWGAEIISEKIQ